MSELIRKTDYEKYIDNFYKIIHIERRHKCIMCDMFKRSSMYITNGRIGVCNRCYPEEFYTTKNKCFEGKGYIKFVVAPYLYIGKIRRVIRQYKFQGQHLYGKLLGQLMCRELSDFDFYREYDMIVPVPLHAKRMAERGYNQSEILAEELSVDWKIPSRVDVMIRIRNTKRQSSLNGKERIDNVKGAFYADKIEVKDKNVILIDDIYTMGETIKACADALKEAGAKDITAVTLCKTMLDEEDEVSFWRR